MEAMPRKRRFPVHWSLEYRRIDDGEWRRGRTVNMSLTGVLFEAAEPLSANDSVELSIMFQTPGQHAASSVVRTRGYVVRTDPKMPPLIAVKFVPAS
jgi:hypothetical protein